MEYLICHFCKKNEECLLRTQDCKRWNTIYRGMSEDLEIMIESAHARYDKGENHDGNMDVHSTG